ncbi:MAG TPA: DUF2269 family protein [Candidatus Limnocylindrales bacterium]
MLQLFLFLHVMGAIAVFGPTFAFPVIARHASQQPQHGHFAAVVSEAIERRIVLPGAIVQGITGVVLILILGADLTSATYRWLIGGIILYLIAVLYAAFVQAPAAERMVALTAGGPPAGAPPPGAPAGPPPEIAATAKKLQQGGMVLTVLIVLIVILMVTKPGF